VDDALRQDECLPLPAYRPDRAGPMAGIVFLAKTMFYL